MSNHKILDRLDELLAESLNSDNFDNGLPTVQSVAEALNVAPNYLSTMLKEMTGQSTQQHIHNKLISKAKDELSTTELSVSEIAYDLGSSIRSHSAACLSVKRRFLLWIFAIV